MTKKNLRKTVTGLALLLLVSALGTGCAFTTDYVDIEYVSQQNVKAIDGAENVSVDVVLFDSRTTKDKVSCKKNGHGQECAPIISNNDVSTLVENAISRELGNRGFKENGNPVKVGVELLKFYSDFKIGFMTLSAAAEVQCSVQVKKKTGGLLYAGVITGTHTLDNISFCSGENAKIALERALEDAVAKLMHEYSFIEALIQSSS